MTKVVKGTQAPGPEGCRHILSLSGGKDSTALALYLKDKIPGLEYVFCDTEKELEETYSYLEKLEVFLGKPIRRIRPDVGFDDLLRQRRGFLPSPQIRWCTENLKIRPFERYIGSDPVNMYVGIRADEPGRTGYISTKPNIKPIFPFVEGGIKLQDVLRILDDSGLGVPEYYKWRSRSGCYFCFYQQRREWVGLLEIHPDLFRLAAEYERVDQQTGEAYTWVQGESLCQLASPERVMAIKMDYEKKKSLESRSRRDSGLLSVFGDESGSADGSCLICHL